MDKVIGTVKAVIFRNDENGFSVIELTSEDNDSLFTAVGVLPAANVGERVCLYGDWTVHKQYGKQLKAVKCELIAADTEVSMIEYLSSGLIKGVGLSTARLIVDRFGEDTFTIIEQTPDRLMEIPGIGSAKAGLISSSFVQQGQMRSAMIALQRFDMTTGQAMKVYKLYGSSCVDKIMQNPYRLVDDIENIGFKTADKIAKSAGIDHDSPFRIRAGLKYILEWANQEGHTFLPKDVLISATVKTLEVPPALVEAALSDMLTSRLLTVALYANPDGAVSDIIPRDDERVCNDAVFLPYMYHLEHDCAARLNKLTNRVVNAPKFSVKDEISQLEKINNIQLAAMQREAIEKLFLSGATVITGGPGTGKTTILKIAIGIMERWGLTYELAAPTGRAAKRMGAATERKARTIHRLLEYSYNDNSFLRDELDPIDADFIIIDEMSMIDIRLMNSLLKAVSDDTKLIMIGDADQLPSVGAGNVLRDIIDSDTVCKIRLNDIYRQAGRSMIVTNAHRINNGLEPELSDNEQDFIFDEMFEPQRLLRKLISLNKAEGDGTLFTKDPQNDVQILAPMKKGVLGVHNLNKCLQEAMNPPSDDKPEHLYKDTIFRLGDKVMQIKNDYNIEWSKDFETGTGVFNGDIGTILRLNNHSQTLEVLFDDGLLAEYDFNMLDELELAYCISIHKSQGSEFPIVVLPIVSGPPMFLTRNLLYTAVTRAKKQVYIIGSKQCVFNMVRNNSVKRRYSALRQMLKELI